MFTVVVYVRWIAFVGGNHSIEVVLDDFHCHGCRDRAAVATVLDQNGEGDARLGRGREPDEPGVVYALVGQRRLVASAPAALKHLRRAGLVPRVSVHAIGSRAYENCTDACNPVELTLIDDLSRKQVSVRS